MASSVNAVSMSTLPNELLGHILGFLDIAPPSSSASELLDEPHLTLNRASHKPLKASSCVSKRWRGAALPFLFRHLQFIALEGERAKTDLMVQIKPLLLFITKHDLPREVKSLTLIAADRDVCDADNGEESYQNQFASFWHFLFAVIDPTIITIVAHPQILAALTSCNISLNDAWAFNTTCHYLRLERPTPASNGASRACESIDVSSIPAYVPPARQARDDTGRPRAVTSELFTIRDWTKLLLNEGSFIRGYATYEWWLRSPPSILADLLGAIGPEDHALLSPTIRDFSYISIFPMSSHFSAIANKLPPLDSIYIQIVPRNDILQDRRVMKQIEAEDLWMERNSCYAMFMRELFNSPPIDGTTLRHNFQQLKVFESGDAADEAAWMMAVEYVKRAGNGWSVGGEGVFVRDPGFVATQTGQEGEGEQSSSPIFNGALVRWAFNGTARLPVSPYPFYRAGG